MHFRLRPHILEQEEVIRIATRVGARCPQCLDGCTVENVGAQYRQIGELIPHTGEHGPFVGCSLYPRCRYTDGVEEDD